MAKMVLVELYIRKTVKVAETLPDIEVKASCKNVLEVHLLSFSHVAMNTSIG